jgi:uncharacterized membrane protein YgdD (TMEM256/DUF423 family)
MTSSTGKKNVLFGLIYFVTTLALGMYMANRGNAGDPVWAESMTRKLLHVAHSHGNLEALVNVVMGLILSLVGRSDQILEKAASWLLILGALCHSGSLYLAGVGLGLPSQVTLVGACSLVAGVVLMIPVAMNGFRDPGEVGS